MSQPMYVQYSSPIMTLAEAEGMRATEGARLEERIETLMCSLVAYWRKTGDTKHLERARDVLGVVLDATRGGAQ